jgi:holo-[acyl-carrier protein] synthase
MIIGLGTDIVQIARIAKLYNKLSHDFAQRILHPLELAELEQEHLPEKFLAKRFAAKEAWAKALGTGFRDRVSFIDMCIVHNKYGAPQLKAQGKLLEFMQEKGVSNSHVSISDEQDYASATVILEG